MPETKQGYFLIADITGYTMYLSQSELEHAQETLQSLLELLIEHTKPPLIISRLAGDAVISYGLQDNFFSGQTFVELIEDTYVSFRKAIKRMVLNNTCQCSACSNVASLDLKFFVHHGSFGIQRLSEHDELVGNDVNLIHRLLKNEVTAQTGIVAYTLYTAAAISRLGLQEVAETMVPHVETYQHLGQVNTWIQDMHPVWRAKKEQVQIQIAVEDALAHEEREFPLSSYVMWDIVTDPEYRAIFTQSTRQRILNRQDGRLAPGSIYQCFHGEERITLQTILEWQPFEQMTTEDTTPIPGAICLFNIKLTPTATGTRLELTCSKARGPWLNRTICNLVGGYLVRAEFRKGMAELQQRLALEMAQGLHAPLPEEVLAIERSAVPVAGQFGGLSDLKQ